MGRTPLNPANYVIAVTTTSDDDVTFNIHGTYFTAAEVMAEKERLEKIYTGADDVIAVFSTGNVGKKYVDEIVQLTPAFEDMEIPFDDEYRTQARKVHQKELKKRKRRAAAVTSPAEGAEPSANKRNPTAYNLFIASKMQSTKDDPENAGKSHKEVFKLITSMWKFADENVHKDRNVFIRDFVSNARSNDDGRTETELEKEAIKEWNAQLPAVVSGSSDTPDGSTQTKKRGRPKKVAVSDEGSAATSPEAENVDAPPAKKRGRPKKNE